jgi:hypothetical protein
MRTELVLFTKVLIHFFSMTLHKAKSASKSNQSNQSSQPYEKGRDEYFITLIRTNLRDRVSIWPTFLRYINKVNLFKIIRRLLNL